MAQRCAVGQRRCIVELHDIQCLFGCFKHDSVFFAVFGIGEVIDIGGGLLAGNRAIIDVIAGGKGGFSGIVERMITTPLPPFPPRPFQLAPPPPPDPLYVWEIPSFPRETLFRHYATNEKIFELDGKYYTESGKEVGFGELD